MTFAQAMKFLQDMRGDQFTAHANAKKHEREDNRPRDQKLKELVTKYKR